MDRVEPGWASTPLERVLAFPSVIDVVRLDDHEAANPVLLAAINQARTDGRHLEPKFATEHAAKWLSATDLHLHAPFAKLTEVVLAACTKRLRGAGYRFDGVRVTEAWAASCRADAPPDQFHCHHNSFVSGVYYVAVPPGSGAITFQNPRFGAGGLRLVQSETIEPAERDGLLSGESVTLAPEAGLLFVFPSWLRHRIERCDIPSGARRVSIAFNVMPTGFLGAATGGLEFR